MRNKNGRNWLGIILVIIGGLWILENFRFPFLYDLNFHHLIFSWSTIFLVVGIILVVNHKDHLPGYIFLLIGGFGTLRKLPFFSDFDFSDFWPLIILFVGLWLVLKRNGNAPNADRGYKNGEFEEHFHHAPTEGFQETDYIDETCIFSSLNKSVKSESFKGGKITTMFGGTKLDLTQSKLAPGENHLEVTTMFGGTEIHVPSNWKVLLNVTSIFGGFEDKRYGRHMQEEQSDGILIIKGVTLFGGGEVLY